MIKEKYKWCISAITMLLAIIFFMSMIVLKKNENINEIQNTRRLSTVLDKEAITEINIDISESDWQWLIDNAANEEYKSCNITINGETYYNVGIRPKGNTSLSNVVSDDTTDRFSFKIKFNEYVDGQNYNGMESIVLNNMIQDYTYIKEYITYDLYESLGVATPEMSFSSVKVNDETWGLYLAIEVIDERYLENNFGTTEGNLYKPETMGVGGGAGAGMGGGNPPDMGKMAEGGQKPPMDENMNNGTEATEKESEKGNTNQQELGQNKTNKGGPGGGRPSEGADFVYIDDEISSYSIVRDSAVFKSTTDEDFKNVINMFKNLNDGTNLEEVLNVEEVLKYFAVNTYVINLDSYSGAMYHNYYLYENNGQCQILPWDLNLSFGGFGANRGGAGGNNSGSTNTINFPIDNPVSGDLESMPLIGKLLEVDEYKELYHSYLKQIADEYFNSGYYEELVTKLDNMINQYVKEDPTKFCTYEQYEASIPEMIQFGIDRTNSVLAQLSGEQPSTTYGDMESTVNLSALGDMGGGGKGKGGDRNNAQAKPENIEVPQSPENASGADKQLSQNKVGDTKQNAEQVPDGIESNTKTDIGDEENNNERTAGQHGRHDLSNQMPKQDKSKDYLMLGGLAVVGVCSTILVNKSKRKRNLK